MESSAQLVRNYRGPALLSYGFRPFFLFGAVWAAAAMALWPALLAGSITLPTTFDPVRWHAHELIYGYVPAIISGFLLTAIPNWTGRLPVVGVRLLALFALWGAGRLAVLFSTFIGEAAAAVIDLLFLAALCGVVARELIAGRNTRNLKVLGVLAVLFAGNTISHAERLFSLTPGHGVRVGIAAILVLIMLIGGRIIPSFTHNWLARQRPGRLSQPFDCFDAVAIAIGAAVLVLWIVAPDAVLTAWLALAAGLVHFWRLGRWAGERTGPEPLVAILHIAYLFVPIGFVLVALGILRPDIVSPSGALHAWTAGAVGTMTLAVMTRASLGHTGQPLTANRAVQTIYIAVIFSALARIVAAFGLARDPMLHVSATAWIFAFVVFAAVFGPLLARPRAS
jgi:uncharacterized protein involved in response to NO